MSLWAWLIGWSAFALPLAIASFRGWAPRRVRSRTTPWGMPPRLVRVDDLACSPMTVLSRVWQRSGRHGGPRRIQPLGPRLHPQSPSLAQPERPQRPPRRQFATRRQAPLGHQAEACRR